MKLRPGNLIFALVLPVFAVGVMPLSWAADLTADQVREVLARAG